MGLQTYFYVYGALTIIGGIIGFVKGHSEASILVGSFTGSIIILATWLRGTFPGMAFVVLLLMSVLLLAKFAPAILMGQGKFMPAGLMSGLSLVSILLLVGRVLLPAKPIALPTAGATAAASPLPPSSGSSTSD